MTPQAGWPKPVDVGTGTQTASFGLDGRWLSIGAAHPRHGYVELSGAPPFNETHRGDPDAVRRYRAMLTDPRHAFLVTEPAPPGAVTIDRDGPRWSSPGHVVTCWCGDGWIVQQHRLSAPAGERARLALRFCGGLQRASFAEITEVDPPPPIGITPSTVVGDGTTLTVTAAGLDASATIQVDVSGATSEGWQPHEHVAAELVVTAAAGGLDVVVRARLSVPVEAMTGSASPDPALCAAAGMPELGVTSAAPAQPGLLVPDAARETLRRITAGAVRYTLGCCVSRVAPGEAAILTDHRLLPLSWTRDAYYQALLLLAVRADVPIATATVADHLRWSWQRARQPGIGWMRAHYPHGAVKDPVVQADQQLYPLLELVDFRRLTGHWPAPPDPNKTDREWWGPNVAAAWDELPRDATTGLLAATENPADDQLELPLLLSTQILYWHVTRWLASFAAELGLDPRSFATTADDVRSRTDSVFACDGPAGPMWAYAADATRTAPPYADANDLPTALAPLWGFCPADNPRWAATMRFACSPANPGYAIGRYGGLGSKHTAGTWPLGDLQEWISASLLAEQQRAERALARVERVAAPDGLLPEAYDPDSGDWLARHWFAWPAAAFGVLTAVATGTLDLAAPEPAVARDER